MRRPRIEGKKGGTDLEEEKARRERRGRWVGGSSLSGIWVSSRREGCKHLMRM